jgi:hypothetical protein
MARKLMYGVLVWFCTYCWLVFFHLMNRPS